MAITLTNIPGIMVINRMPVGAALMRSWFGRPVAIKPAYGTNDTTTVKMSWVLSFKRAKDVYDQIVSNKLWMNYAAQKVIESKLKTKGLVGSVPQNFGDLTQPAPTLDKDQINHREVGMSSIVDALDDMDAALGNFGIQVAIAGTVSPKGSIHQVDIKEVGIFAKDSYDFNDFQYLGTWDDVANTVGRSPTSSGDTVWNSTFRDWRTTNGMGGDYMIYSDVVKITTSDSFSIPVPPQKIEIPREYGPKY